MHVVVIGAGVLGITTGYYLRRQGIEVTLLERQNGPALGASFGNGGYLQATAPDPWTAPGVGRIFRQAWVASLSGRKDESAFVARTSALPGLISWGLRFFRHANLKAYLDHTVENSVLAQYSLEATRELGQEEGFEYHASDQGGLIVFRSSESLTSYEQLAAHMRQKGARYQRLSREALYEKEPSLAHLGEKLVGAIYYPDDGAGDAREFCQGALNAAQRRGVRFEFGAPVSNIVPADGKVQVCVGGEGIAADAVVIAAGVGSKALAQKVGLKLPIAPAKGYSISVPMQAWPTRPKHVIADMGVHAGLNPMGDYLRVAGTAEFCGEDLGVTNRRTHYMIDLVRQLYPEYADAIDPAEVNPWAGLRPLCADGLPIIGETPVPGVFLNTGHGGLGWTQGAGSAKAVADVVAGLKPEIELHAYAFERF